MTWCFCYYLIWCNYSLPETKSSHLKHWKMIFFFLGEKGPNFQVRNVGFLGKSCWSLPITDSSSKRWPFRQENEEDEMVALASQVLGDVIPRVYGKVWWGCLFFGLLFKRNKLRFYIKDSFVGFLQLRIGFSCWVITYSFPWYFMNLCYFVRIGVVWAISSKMSPSQAQMALSWWVVYEPFVKNV